MQPGNTGMMSSVTNARIARTMSADEDVGPYACSFRYVLCTTPRTGSSMLSASLREFGSLGYPHEYLNLRFVKAWADRCGMARVSMTQYLRFLESRRCSPNGVFGLKVHFSQLEPALGESNRQAEFLRRFDRCIVLGRRNKVAQAISWLR